MSATVPTQLSGLAPRFSWLQTHGELLRALVRRELRSKYKGSALGVLWSYIHPLLMMGVYTLVFSVLWRAVDIPHYPLFVLSGLAVWTLFQTALVAGAGSLVSDSHLIKKVWFPREVIPLAVVTSSAVSALVMFVVVVPVNLVVVADSRKTFLLAVPIFVAFLCLTLGFAWILATANVFFRDVEHLVGALLLPLFFLTPVFYGLEQLPGAAEHPWLIELLRWGNPVTPYVEGIRAAILQGVVPGAPLLVYVFVVGPAVALAGLWVIQRYSDRFAVEL